MCFERQISLRDDLAEKLEPRSYLSGYFIMFKVFYNSNLNLVFY